MFAKISQGGRDGEEVEQLEPLARRLGVDILPPTNQSLDKEAARCLLERLIWETQVQCRLEVELPSRDGQMGRWARDQNPQAMHVQLDNGGFIL